MGKSGTSKRRQLEQALDQGKSPAVAMRESGYKGKEAYKRRREGKAKPLEDVLDQRGSVVVSPVGEFQSLLHQVSVSSTPSEESLRDLALRKLECLLHDSDPEIVAVAIKVALAQFGAKRPPDEDDGPMEDSLRKAIQESQWQDE